MKELKKSVQYISDAFDNQKGQLRVCWGKLQFEAMDTNTENKLNKQRRKETETW